YRAQATSAKVKGVPPIQSCLRYVWAIWLVVYVVSVRVTVVVWVERAVWVDVTTVVIVKGRVVVVVAVVSVTPTPRAFGTPSPMSDLAAMLKREIMATRMMARVILALNRLCSSIHLRRSFVRLFLFLPIAHGPDPIFHP
ncbi:MAG: hypothetical protein QXJ15_03095, partial [Candidatus Bathyarchaeia archaeon]